MEQTEYNRDEFWAKRHAQIEEEKRADYELARKNEGKNTGVTPVLPEEKSPSPRPSPLKGEGGKESAGEEGAVKDTEAKEEEGENSGSGDGENTGVIPAPVFTRVNSAGIQEKDAELEAKEKALTPYSDNLPYDRNRVIQELGFLFKHEIAGRYEIGKRLILLREHEGDNSFIEILQESFPGVGRRSAYRYIAFTARLSALPNLRNMAEGGGWTKALEFMNALDDEELARLEAGEPVGEKTLDEYDKMTTRELKEALKKAKAQNAKLCKQIENQRETFDGALSKKKSAKLNIAHLAMEKFVSGYIEIKNIKLSEAEPEVLQAVIDFYRGCLERAQMQYNALMKQAEIRAYLEAHK